MNDIANKTHGGPITDISLKVHLFNQLLLGVAIVAFGFILSVPVEAQTFRTLLSFSATSTNSSGVFTNNDGANPYAALTGAPGGKTWYGTASLGGNAGNGAVFAINPDGTGFTVLHSFTAASVNSSGDSTNSDGIGPWSGLIVGDNTLYGTAYRGGAEGEGTIFALNADGTRFRTLHTFSATGADEVNADGAYPNGQLVLSGNKLYGTAYKGGSSGFGTVFSVNSDGTEFAVMHSFTNGLDGAVPVSALIFSGSSFYGTASGGGAGRNGTIFAINLDGTGFTVVHAFEPRSENDICISNFDCWPGWYCRNIGQNGIGTCQCNGFCGGIRGGDTTPGPRPINNEGANPNAALILSGNTLYGTTAAFGPRGFGTVFRLDTDGTGFRVLHSFTGGSDGANPWAGLSLSGHTLYSTAYGGGVGFGTVFALDADTGDFTVLHSFTGGSDGANPIGGLLLSGNTLSGTAELGGSSGGGTIFSLSFAPQLTSAHLGANLVLTWPTNYAGFDYTGYALQSTTNLVAPVVWTTASPGPVDNSGLSSVIHPISGGRQFYRLIRRCPEAGPWPGPGWVIDLDTCHWVFMSGPGPGD